MQKSKIKKVVKNKFSKLDGAISKLFHNSFPTVKFTLKDGRILNQPIKDSFLLNEKGGRRKIYQIKNDLFALKHDLNAVSFKI